MRYTSARVTLMPRHEPHAGSKYDKPVVMKLNVEGLRRLDELRAGMSRSAYLRGLLREESKRRPRNRTFVVPLKVEDEKELDDTGKIGVKSF